MINKRTSKYILLSVFLILSALLLIGAAILRTNPLVLDASSTSEKKDYIKWVNFDVSSRALERAYKYDVESRDWEVKINLIELLALLGNKYGGDFSRYKEKDMTEIVEKLKNKEATIESLSQNMKYYQYYHDAYEAVLGGMVGPYKIEVPDENAPGGKRWKKDMV
jgi:hypothetical protein